MFEDELGGQWTERNGYWAKPKAKRVNPQFLDALILDQILQTHNYATPFVAFDNGSRNRFRSSFKF